MLHGFSSNNGNKPLVFKKAEYDGKIKHLGYSDGWLHTECGGTLSPNGTPGYFDCKKCGSEFKKQPMLLPQVDTRDERAKALLPTVRLEHRDDKIGLIRFVVDSQSRPKRYLVYRDNHGNWTCPCEDFQKHKQYDAWHCKHVMACEYWLENEKASKERAATIRPSLICTGTQEEFSKANSLDERQIVRSAGEAYTSGDDGMLAYLINGKVAISYCGTMTLAKMMGIEISDVETKEASQMMVATAKATNPKTGVTQAGAHSQSKRFDGGRVDNDAEIKASGKAKRNAILKVIPEYVVYDFANKHAQNPPFDYLDAYSACVKVFTRKGLGEWHVANITKELFPERQPAELNREQWIRIFRTCQKHADELSESPEVQKEKAQWAKTIDGQIVAATKKTRQSQEKGLALSPVFSSFSSPFRRAALS